MKIISYLLIFSLIYFCACSSMYKLKDSDFTFEKLNEEIEGERVSITLTDRRKEYEAENVSVNDSLTHWTDSHSDRTYTVPTSKVYKIISIQHTQGALEGYGLGILTGGTLGVLIVPSDEQSKILGWVAIGGTISIIGLVYGAVVGHEDTYVINDWQ